MRGDTSSLDINKSYEFNTLSYLRNQGFLPSYGFSSNTIRLDFWFSGDYMYRSKTQAIRELAPLNIVYFSGKTYLLKYARPSTRNLLPVVENCLICSECGHLEIKSTEIDIAVCPQCKKDLQYCKDYKIIELPNMLGQPSKSITSDEEERLRRGYNISQH